VTDARTGQLVSEALDATDARAAAAQSPSESLISTDARAANAQTLVETIGARLAAQRRGAAAQVLTEVLITIGGVVVRLALLNSPELQFIDANGEPYAGGTFATYVSGTTTPKDTWQDPGGTILNTNPIILDAAGRCIVWGDGLYRCVLHDADGNLVFDEPSTTLVSAAMVPVVSAPTIADAVELLGIQDLIDAAVTGERARAEAAEAALSAAIIAETSRAAAAEGALLAAINAETARAEAAEAAILAAGHGFQSGQATANAAGQVRVSFSPAFSSPPKVATAIAGNALVGFSVAVNVDAAGFDAFVVFSGGGGTTPAAIAFDWIAVGPN
jgi:hypothetical protein